MQNWLKRSYKMMIIAPRGPLFVAVQFASITIAIVSCVVSIYSGVVSVTIANAPLLALWFMIEVDRGAYQRKLQDKIIQAVDHIKDQQRQIELRDRIIKEKQRVEC